MNIGADIEFFVKVIDDIVPVQGYLDGSKKDPVILHTYEGTFQYHRDNVLAEVAIPVTESRTDFSACVAQGKRLLNESLGDKGAYVCNHTAEHRFPENLLREMEQLESGCDKDFDVRRMRPNKPVNMRELGGLRMAGGHIHLDCAPVPEEQMRLVKTCDVFLAGPSLFEDKQTRQRRKYYGRAGTFRPKTYGIEYRTLSNYWAQSTRFSDRIYSRARQASDYAINYGGVQLSDWEIVVACIDDPLYFHTHKADVLAILSKYDVPGTIHLHRDNGGEDEEEEEEEVPFDEPDTSGEDLRLRGIFEDFVMRHPEAVQQEEEDNNA